jgi:hypothetical protein
MYLATAFSACRRVCQATSQFNPGSSGPPVANAQMRALL